MNVEVLLSRLDKVRRTGTESWVARCPAHDDRTPSLTIRETASGRILAHCFGGCDIAAIVGAVGLALDDLFERPIANHLPPLKRRFPAADVLECCAKEATIAALCASAMAKGPLSREDSARCMTAAQRLREAVDAIR